MSSPQPPHLNWPSGGCRGKVPQAHCLKCPDEHPRAIVLARDADARAYSHACSLVPLNQNSIVHLLCDIKIQLTSNQIRSLLWQVPDGGAVPSALGERVATRLTGRRSRLPDRQHGARMLDANFGLFFREKLVFHCRPARGFNSRFNPNSIRPVPRTSLPVIWHTSLQQNNFQH